MCNENLFTVGKFPPPVSIYSDIKHSFFLPNNPRNLDPSYKMDLDLWDCLERLKFFQRTDLVICCHSKERKTPSFSRINTVGVEQSTVRSAGRLLTY